MGFLDKAKAAATDLAAKADTALSSSGLGGHGGTDSDSYLRDLGVLTYLELTGRPVPPGERERVLDALRQLDSAGAIRSFALRTQAAPPPGTPGGAGYVPPPPGAGAVPPARGAVPAAPPAGQGPVPPPPGAAAPEAPDPTPTPPPAAAPPPPSWAG